MRIQNNITAMNTHRMYTINNDNVAKSAEKLSSGYRINRAGDDAAGLAISEKMRAQIRGLNMATKNSQDAISLVQTAEGALQETHSMLQRMNELAVQAATGTNEGFDRTQAAKEFEQLKREINDVAEQTNFNNMKILDGSLSYEGYVRSAQTAGVNNTIATTDGAQAGPFVQTDFRAGSDQIAASAGTFNLATTKTTTIADLAGGDKFQVQVTLKDGTKLLSEDIFTVDGTSTPATYESAIKGVGSNKKLNFAGTSTNAGVKISTANSDGDLKIEGDTPRTDRVLDFTGAEISFIKHEDPALDDGKEIKITGTETVSNSGKINGVIPGVASTATYTVDPSKVSFGDTFTVSDKTLEIVKDAADVTGTNTAVVWDGKDTQQLLTNMATAIQGGTNIATGAVTGENTITVTSSVPTNDGDAAKFDAAIQLKATGSSDNKGTTNTIEFDVAKMKNGDEFTFKISGQTAPVTVKYEGESRANFMKKVEKQFADVNNAEVKGNAVIIKDAKVDIKLEDNWKSNVDATNAIRIQVGANENEQLALSIDSMNTAGLGLDNAFLTIAGQSTDQNIDSAGAAITAVTEAINKVSDQRATLGAMQNRLDHKIANLKVSSENLSAAESRIRDVDMASEMTNFTKNNILSQAATAMLAQANALPQNVLSLLG